MNSKTSILIVDDDRDLAESLADVLEARGYAVELAGSGSMECRLFTAFVSSSAYDSRHTAKLPIRLQDPESVARHLSDGTG